jgi:hypothetical protein
MIKILKILWVLSLEVGLFQGEAQTPQGREVGQPRALLLFQVAVLLFLEVLELELPLAVIRGVGDQLLVYPLHPLVAVLLFLEVLELELPLVGLLPQAGVVLLLVVQEQLSLAVGQSYQEEGAMMTMMKKRSPIATLSGNLQKKALKAAVTMMVKPVILMYGHGRWNANQRKAIHPHLPHIQNCMTNCLVLLKMEDTDQALLLRPKDLIQTLQQSVKPTLSAQMLH